MERNEIRKWGRLKVIEQDFNEKYVRALTNKLIDCEQDETGLKWRRPWLVVQEKFVVFFV